MNLQDDVFKPYHKMGVVKQVDGDNIIWMTVIKKVVDRDGEVILPDAPVKHIDSYLNNPVVLFSHSRREPPVGRMLDYEVTSDEFVAKDQIAVDESDFAAMLFKLYEGGYMSACSIGFRPVLMNRKKLFEEQTGVTFVEIEMLEHSLVTIPSNREALKREWESLKSLDDSFKKHIEKFNDIPPTYDCGHHIFFDADGNYPEECPNCQEKSETESESEPETEDGKFFIESSFRDDFGSRFDGLFKVYGTTDSTDGHYHEFEFAVDDVSNVAGKTTPTAYPDDEGDFTLSELRTPFSTAHSHIITDSGVTKPSLDHVHQISLTLGLDLKRDGLLSRAESCSDNFTLDRDSIFLKQVGDDGEIQTYSLVLDKAKAVAPFKDLPLADKGAVWSRSNAEKRVREWAKTGDEVDFKKYRQAFVYYDSSKPDNFGSYKLMIADVFDGVLKAVPRAIYAAAASVQGARGGVNIPEGEIPRVKSHLGKYYKKLGEKPPWDKSDSELELELKEGRRISKTNLNKINNAINLLNEVVDSCRPDDEEDGDDKDQKESELFPMVKLITKQLDSIESVWNKIQKVEE